MIKTITNHTMLALGEAHMRAFGECYDDTKRQHAVLDYHHDVGVNWVGYAEIKMNDIKKSK